MYNEPLTAIGQRIHRTFGVLEARLTRDLPAVTLQPESQRFERWGGDAGLYDQGRSSLDQRFREPPSVLSFVYRLLRDLDRYLVVSKEGHYVP